MLLADAGLASAVNTSTAQRWRRLARLSVSDFREAVRSGNDSFERQPKSPVAHVTMVRTEFERGNMHRRVYGVEDSTLTLPSRRRPPVSLNSQLKIGNSSWPGAVS